MEKVTHKLLIRKLPKAIHKLLQTEWLQQQKFIFLRFWRLEIQDKRCSRGWISGEVSLPSLQVATTLLCPHIVLSLCTQKVSSDLCLPLLAWVYAKSV